MCSSRIYDAGVDVWSVGCILAELFLRKPFFPGNNHIEQLKLIFHYLGTPKDLDWIKTPDARRWVSNMTQTNGQDFNILFPNTSNLLKDLILKLLEINPNKRITVDEALKHPWLNGLYRSLVHKSIKSTGIDKDICVNKFDLSFEFEKSIKTLFGVQHMMYEELNGIYKIKNKKIQRKKIVPIPRSNKIIINSNNNNNNNNNINNNSNINSNINKSTNNSINGN